MQVIVDDFICSLVGRTDFSCYQLCIHIYKHMGLKIPDIKKAKVQSLAYEELVKYDLIFFDFTGKGRIDHVGLYLGNGQFIHCLDKAGVIISKLTHRYFSRRYMGRLIVV